MTNAIPLRAYVNFEEHIGHVGVVATVAGYPIYAGVSGEVRVDKNTGVVATCRGGNIGRLQIPAPVAAYAERLVPMLLGSIQNQQQLLRQLKSVQINKGEIVLESKGSSSLPPAAPPKASPVSTPVR